MRRITSVAFIGGTMTANACCLCRASAYDKALLCVNRGRAQPDAVHAIYVMHAVPCHAHNLVLRTQSPVTNTIYCHAHNPCHTHNSMLRTQSYVTYTIPCPAYNLMSCMQSHVMHAIPSHARSAASPRSSRSYSCARYSESSCGMSGLCVSPRSQHSMKCCAS